MDKVCGGAKGVDIVEGSSDEKDCVDKATLNWILQN
jgi:hypothetical protein